MTLIARILIVEDEQEWLDDFLAAFRTPPDLFVSRYQAPRFEVDVATSGAEAWRLLQQAKDRLQPYDVLVLDLRLPEVPEDVANPKVEVGLEVLKGVDEQSCTTIVVYSNRKDEPTLLEVIRSKAADFVPKEPLRRDCENLFCSVTRAWRSAQATREARWHHCQFREHRMHQWRLVQSCSQVADLMAAHVSEGVATLLDLTDQLRIALDVGTAPGDLESNRMARDTLVAFRKAAGDLVRSCAQARGQASARSGGDQLFPVVLERVCQQALENFRPGIVYRRLEVEAPLKRRHEIRTFERDVEAVVEELLGYVIDNAQEGTKLGVEVSDTEDHLGVEIRLHTQGSLDAKAERILSGEEDSFGPIAGDRWGLTLARRIAPTIGAWVEVASQPAGTLITLRIPVNADD